MGPPKYDDTGSYIGPLPRLHNQPSMRNRATSGPFKTTGTEQWPIRMCQWIVAMLLDTCSAAATTATEGREADNRTDKVEYNDERRKKSLPGRAKHWQATRTCTTAEGHVHRPGRWRKEVRELADGANWYWLRREMKKAILDFVGSEKELELEAFRMALGGEANWRVARDEGLQSKLLGILCRWLEAQDMREKDLDGIVRSAPTAETAKKTARSRRRPGVSPRGGGATRGDSLPATPHVFEEQLRWPLHNQPWEPELRWVPNYSSVEKHVEFAEAKFEEDIAEGLMLKMSYETSRLSTASTER